MTNNADELLHAANTLLARAQAVTAHNGGSDLWFDADVDLRNAIRGTFLGNKKSAPDDARWIALMTPSVGIAVADRLAFMAGVHVGDGPDGCADCARWLPLARLINGGAA